MSTLVTSCKLPACWVGGGGTEGSSLGDWGGQESSRPAEGDSASQPQPAAAQEDGGLTWLHVLIFQGKLDIQILFYFIIYLFIYIQILMCESLILDVGN